MTGGQRGQALVESILLGLLFLVPVVWLLGVLSELHRAALASTAAVREAGFDAARSTDAISAAGAVESAVAAAFANHELDPEDADVSWTAPEGLRRGSEIEIHVSYRVPVVQAPFLGSVAGPSIGVEARHIARVDPFRSRR